MLSLKSIRRKIKTVKNIQKITQAMKMVAAAKLKKVQGRVAASRPYAHKMRDLMGAVAPYAEGDLHPLLARREARTIGLVVIAGDKGLCGSFNNNVLRKATAHVASLEGKTVKLMTVGRKATDYFRRRSYDVAASLPLPGVNAALPEIRKISHEIAQWYETGQVDEVWIAYAVFVSTMMQKPDVVRFLPIEPQRGAAGSVPGKESLDARGAAAGATEAKAGEGAAGAGGMRRSYIFEPEAPRLLGDLVPRYVENQVYQYLLEAMASEQGARMTAMTQASDNAGELIGTLTQDYNKARQWTITKELLDIVGGAEALKKAN